MPRLSRAASASFVLFLIGTILGCAGGVGGAGTDCKTARHEAYVRCCEQRFYKTYVPDSTGTNGMCLGDIANEALAVCVNDLVPSECEH